MAAPRLALSSDPRSEAKKPVTIAGRWGQVPTPDAIAVRMAKRLLCRRPHHGVRILDPCVGTFTFPKALQRAGVLRSDDQLELLDIDPSMVQQSSRWARERSIRFSVECADYIETELTPEYDYAILNPPYVRQEWLESKENYIAWFRERYHLEVPGTSNLYVYFVVKVLHELRPGGRLACILYDSWQSTRFGAWLADLLESECSRIDTEPEPNQPFNGRLIDATIIYAEKNAAGNQTKSRSVARYDRLRVGPLSSVEGFCPVTDAFHTRRGLRLKQADFFLCDQKTAGKCGATPFLKKVSRFSGYKVPEDHPEAALLITPGSRKPTIERELRRRLELAKKTPDENVSILTWFKERPDAWMLHRPAPYAEIVLNYYIRHRPKHITTSGFAYSDNFYGLTSRASVPTLAWLAALNSTAACVEILFRARNQGSGLAKVQLFEYRNAHIPNLTEFSRRDVQELQKLGLSLLNAVDPRPIIRCIDRAIAAVFGDSRLRPPTLEGIFTDVDERARKPKDTIECLG